MTGELGKTTKRKNILFWPLNAVLCKVFHIFISCYKYWKLEI